MDVDQVTESDTVIVQLNKNGKVFEIICYLKKAVSWDLQTETDLNKVLETQSVFHDAKNHQLAKDLDKVFDGLSLNEIFKLILNKGKMQTSDEKIEALLAEEISLLMSKMSIDIETKKRLDVSEFEDFILDDALSCYLYEDHKGRKNIKDRAFYLLRRMTEDYYIDIGNMKIQIELPGKNSDNLKAKLLPMIVNIESQQYDEKLLLCCLINSENYEKIVNLIKKETKNEGKVVELDF